MSSLEGTTRRRADRLRRNPIVAIVVGFPVLFGGLEAVAAGIIYALSGGPFAILLTSLVVAPLAIIAGVVEELFLRGELFRVTEKYLGTSLALVVSALFFGFLHLANPDASLWADGAFGLEASVIVVALWLAVAVGLLASPHRRGRIVAPRWLMARAA